MPRPFILDENGNEVPCAVEGCAKSRQRKNGFCDPHYWRNHKNGSPTAIRANRYVGSNQERFWAKVDKTGECWVWSGSLVSGYGTFRWNEQTDEGFFYGRERAHESAASHRVVKAHRLSFFWHNGYWPAPGRHIDHLCRNTRCVNPDHLEDVTQAENNRRNPNWSGNGGKTVQGIKRPMSWIHNKFHVNGQGRSTMGDCERCKATATMNVDLID